MEHAVDKLTLINRALWEIIQKHLPVDNDHLIAKVNEIDMRDGKLDGKLDKKTVRTCAYCGKTLSRKHRKCIYCGTADTQADAFDSVR